MANKENPSYFLWERFKNGDDDAFYRIYDQYFNELYSYALNFSKDQDFIKDCIHDLFLNLYKYRKTLSSTDNIQYYLLRSLRRLLHKEGTKRNTLLHDEQLLHLNDIPVVSLEDEIIANETKKENFKALADVMKKLTKKQREALSLKFEHNLSYPQIADTLNISVESARTMIYRTLKELRKAIKKGKTSNSILLFFMLRNRI
ncbi:RNA polymerase sigma factor [Draconibacterium sediminis]|uniref:RNA polymerase sigma factor n=1 Tax=Draconibacterium sediminis TaxID=1544798 RepID=UPI0026F0FC2F|nr:sigma-70 family RNA polymerase sigma factor [Draconibacterium sediminis]